MELLKNDTGWFLSQAGTAAYERQRTLEEKTIFIYAYLSKALDKSFDKDSTCFKFALFLADAIDTAGLPYSRYPALIDPTQNPYLAYLVNLGEQPGGRIIYYGFMSILHEIADPMMQNNWIYDMELMGSDSLEEKLVSLEHDFYEEIPNSLPNPLVFDIAEELEPVQLKIMWFFGNK